MAAAPAEEHEQPAAVPQSGFPIVGIGASAGGLAAIEAFFSGMPQDGDPGMAFVLVQHLAPGHKSILADLLKRYTRMKVLEAENGMVVQPNCTYIIPPNRDLSLRGDALWLDEHRETRGPRLTIDHFFRSLAAAQHERAICVVMSGTGSDGTLGVRAIKGEGGLAIAQAPETAEYDGMPRSAIATGMVDYVLPPAEIPGRLLAYARTGAWRCINSTAARRTSSGRGRLFERHPAVRVHARSQAGAEGAGVRHRHRPPGRGGRGCGDLSGQHRGRYERGPAAPLLQLELDEAAEVLRGMLAGAER